MSKIRKVSTQYLIDRALIAITKIFHFEDGCKNDHYGDYEKYVIQAIERLEMYRVAIGDRGISAYLDKDMNFDKNNDFDI